MKIKVSFYEGSVTELLNIFCLDQNSKLKHVMIQFRFHDIHISDQT
jgi:hypothetical protein